MSAGNVAHGREGAIHIRGNSITASVDRVVPAIRILKGVIEPIEIVVAVLKGQRTASDVRNLRDAVGGIPGDVLVENRIAGSVCRSVGDQ